MSQSPAENEETGTERAPTEAPAEALPPWKVLLHNDDENEIRFVVETVETVTPLDREAARERTREAHETGMSLILTTHKERAELYKEQLVGHGLTATIEPARG